MIYIWLFCEEFLEFSSIKNLVKSSEFFSAETSTNVKNDMLLHLFWFDKKFDRESNP